jgi:hypothetical protein
MGGLAQMQRLLIKVAEESAVHNNFGDLIYWEHNIIEDL